MTGAGRAVADALGPEAAVDAVAVLANSALMTRLADGTGARHEQVDDVAQATGADRFGSAR